MTRHLITFVGITALVLCGAFGQSNTSGQTSGYVEFDPLSTVSLNSGHTTPVQFTFHIKSGYHINSSKTLTEYLIPTSIGFTPPPDVVIAKVQYPAGQLISFPFDPTQKLSVYSGDVIVKAAIITQPSAPPGTYTVHGEFKYQACDNNACYPPKKLPVQFDVKVAKATTTHTKTTKQSPHIR